MNNQATLWLYPLILFAIIVLCARSRTQMQWSWGYLVQSLSVFACGVAGFITGYPSVWAGLGWLLIAFLFIVPRLIMQRLEYSFTILDDVGALKAASLLRYFIWGLPGELWIDMARAFGHYVHAEQGKGDQLIEKWQANKYIPDGMRDTLVGFRLSGAGIVWDWPAIVAEFEAQQNSQGGVKRSKGHCLAASRAYAELGEIGAAAKCLEHAGIAESRASVKTAALTLLPFFALCGAKSEVEQLTELISRGPTAVPPFTRKYWLGRCLATSGDLAGARSAFEQTAELLKQQPNVALATTWNMRVQRQIAALQDSKPPTTPDTWKDEVKRVWQIFEQTLFVQSIVAPRKHSRVVAILCCLILSSYVLMNYCAGAADQQTYEQCKNLLILGYLDPQKVFAGEYWRLVTYLFIHKHITHCAVNVLGLYWFGRIAQNIFGTWNFLLIYFASGIVSGIAHSLIEPHVLAIGASGAVMGVFGATAIGVFRLKGRLPESIRRFEIGWMGGLALVQIILDRIVPQVAGIAHLGGLLAGTAIGWFLAKGPQSAEDISLSHSAQPPTDLQKEIGSPDKD